MKKPFGKKTIIFGITGGIAAYKCCDVVRGLVKAGADVHVILTKAAEHFVTPLTLQTLSQNPVHTEMFSLIQEAEIGHISLADNADLVVVAPSTADVIAKVACGICDELLLTVICATRAPVVFAPSMNVHMWENKITQENIKRLKKVGYHFIDPATGDLACGYQGKGRLPEPEEIIKVVEQIFRKNPKH
jgi:phosphopantothenoylcysteine decarboxylase/phosphopantothenate--cysteine ligase